jgi:Tol biopolymer transport system component
MNTRLRTVLLAGLLLAIGASLLYWWSIPRLLEVSPPDGTTAVSAGSPIRLTFSHRMQEASLIKRLAIVPNHAGTYTWQGKTLVFTPGQPWPEGATIRVKLEAGGLTAGLLSLPLPEGKSWSFRIRQPRLAYLYPANRPADLYLLNPFSGETQRLTNLPGGIQDFCVNASGTAIYYSVRNGEEDSAIYRLDLPASESVLPTPEATPQATHPSPQLTSILILDCPQAQCESPAISPKGDYLAYERTSVLGSDTPHYPQVWYIPLPLEKPVNPGSTPAQPLLPVRAGDAGHQTLQPMWSPSGLLSLYDTNAAAFVFLDIATGQQTLFPNQTGQPGTWHPNGRDFVTPEIFFIDINASDMLTGTQPLADSQLILFNRVAGTTQDLTPAKDMEDAAPAFSPDGTSLAFARKYLDVERWTPGRQLWLMRTGSQEARPLTNDPFYNHFDIAWSPEGDRLAYVRFNQAVFTEPPEIWMIDPLTDQETRLVIGGYTPQWIP